MTPVARVKTRGDQDSEYRSQLRKEFASCNRSRMELESIFLYETGAEMAN